MKFYYKPSLTPPKRRRSRDSFKSVLVHSADERIKVSIPTFIVTATNENVLRAHRTDEW